MFKINWLLIVTVALIVSGNCRAGSHSSGPRTIFTGTPLQYRWGQPARNVARAPARLWVRATRPLFGKPAYPEVWSAYRNTFYGHGYYR